MVCDGTCSYYVVLEDRETHMKKIVIICVLVLNVIVLSACKNQDKRSLVDNTTVEDLVSSVTDTEMEFSDTNTTELSENTAKTEDREDVTTSPTTEEPAKEYIDYLQSDGRLELPVNGATGYAAINMNIKTDVSNESENIGSLTAGQEFVILQESGEWWQIEAGDVMGWVPHQNCFVNLPDVIPSIVYYDTNAFSSAFLSSGKTIPNISGLQLYEAYSYNERLDKEEYIMPVLYSMSFKICAAQQAALQDGNTLVLYEGFRPYEVQQMVVTNLKELAKADSEVNKGISTSPWDITWFIANSLSNHQRGVAIDVSLGEVLEEECFTTGDYTYTDVTSYSEYTMPTGMHELSAAAVAFQYPVSSKSDTEWRTVPLSDSMNEPAIWLQQYCTNAGLSPLASEWWHFNDLATLELIRNNGNRGNYYLSTIVSREPEK